MRGAIDDDAEVVVAALRGVGHRQQAELDHDGNEQRHRDAFFGQRAHDLRRVEVLLQIEGVARLNRDEGEEGRRGVVDRRDDEGALTRHGGEGHARLGDVRADRGLGEHGALRPPRRAARVHLIEIHRVGDDAVRRRLGLVCDEVVPALPVGIAGVDGDPTLDLRQLAAHGGDRGHELAPGDQEPRLRVVQDVGPLGRRQAEVQRDGYDAGLRGAEVDQEVLDAVLGKDRETIAHPETRSDEGIRQAVRRRVGLPVAEAAISEFAEDHIGSLARPIFEIVVKSHARSSFSLGMVGSKAPDEKSDRHAAPSRPASRDSISARISASRSVRGVRPAC